MDAIFRLFLRGEIWVHFYTFCKTGPTCTQFVHESTESVSLEGEASNGQREMKLTSPLEKLTGK